MRLAHPLALAALAAVSLSACGDSDPSGAELREARDRVQIEAAAADFAAAVAAGDAKAFCAALAPNDKARLAGGRSDGERRCLVVWGPQRNPFFAAEDPDLSLAEIAELDPPTAVARLGNGGRLVFAQEAGAWYVSLAPQGKE